MVAQGFTKIEGLDFSETYAPVARCLYFVTSRINPQAHGYRCSFHPRVFQGIVSTREREYTIYGFRLSKDTHTGVGRIGQRGLPLESMFRRRDHVAVILQATGFDRLIQAASSNNTCSIEHPNVEDYEGSNRAVTTCRLPIQTVGLSDN